MSQVNLRDPEDVRRALLPWLHDHLPGAEEIMLPPPKLPEIGGSSETFLIRPTIRTKGEVQRKYWVLRIEASGYQIYKDPSVERQFRVMQVLAEQNSVPVPKPLWFEADTEVLGARFFLMEGVQGQALPTLHHSQGLLTQVSPGERERMWISALQALAKIHCVPAEPFAFLGRPELGESGLKQDIVFWRNYLEWSEVSVRPEQERAQRWLDDHRPAELGTGLAWGDARPGNIIFHDHACQAVIDWETASLATAETDLGWWLFYDWNVSDGLGIPRLDGTGDRDFTIRTWEHFAGRKAVALEWHEVYATWRYSLIVDRARLLAIRINQPQAVPAQAGMIVANRLLALTGN